MLILYSTVFLLFVMLCIRNLADKLQNKKTCSQAVFRKNVSQDSVMVLLKCQVQNYFRLGTLILAWLTMRTNLIISAVEVGESA